MCVTWYEMWHCRQCAGFVEAILVGTVRCRKHEAGELCETADDEDSAAADCQALDEEESAAADSHGRRRAAPPARNIEEEERDDEDEKGQSRPA
ncbi:hypothetical protein SPI_05081 [Niveomyces insectorum RCEF 264]|uniref:Uncharacterized protein n=1 Tax=Niveomyces insectorum RCEF 264 TaxID=1081102 RepID=A0A167TXP8_9HYPO|nr:hypothetical protein SPI_05081 [Niveomyces insectorum RCEF 264]